MRQLLTDFYQEVSQDQRTRTPLFADQHLEQDQQNGYVSATACQRCHQQEYLQWSATRHAFAYETASEKGTLLRFRMCLLPHYWIRLFNGVSDRRPNRRSKACSVRRATVPANSTWAIRKKVISVVVRIHRSVWNAMTRNILRGSQMWWHSTRRMLITAANR